MVLNLNSIRKSYRTNEGEVPVLNNISLNLLAGEKNLNKNAAFVVLI